MVSLSAWLLAIFRKRMDVLDLRITQKHRHNENRQRLNEIQDRLKETLSREQFQFFLEWETLMNERFSKEREEWYFSGVSDGLGLSMSMDELGRSLLEHESYPQKNSL